MRYNTLGLFHSIKRAAVVKCCSLMFVFAANAVEMLMLSVETLKYESTTLSCFWLCFIYNAIAPAK